MSELWGTVLMGAGWFVVVSLIGSGAFLLLEFIEDLTR